MLGCIYLFKLKIFLDSCPGVRLLDHMVALLLVFVWNLHTLFHSAYSKLHSHQHYRKVTFSPSLQHLLVCRFFLMMAILTCVEVIYLTVVLICISLIISKHQGFPGSSASKESACNAGNPSLIPGSGRSPEEGKGYPLQYSWASLVAQLVKNLPAMQETWVRSLGQGDTLETVMAAYSSILVWIIPWSFHDHVQFMGSQRVGYD